jgi:hypothetical protein|tara:strand:- start:18 stop:179 length:162 start_codon:yes stop_codon:yes gene_type:complete
LIFLKFPRFIREKLSQKIAALYVVKKLPVGKRGKQKIKTTKKEDKLIVFLFAK